jgi:ribosomal protein S15P/S13E
LVRSPGFTPTEARERGAKIGENLNPQQQQDGRITDLFCTKNIRRRVKLGDILFYFFSCQPQFGGLKNKVKVFAIHCASQFSSRSAFVMKLKMPKVRCAMVVTSMPPMAEHLKQHPRDGNSLYRIDSQVTGMFRERTLTWESICFCNYTTGELGTSMA